jgi:hypothetical protein
MKHIKRFENFSFEEEEKYGRFAQERESDVAEFGEEGNEFNEDDFENFGEDEEDCTTCDDTNELGEDDDDYGLSEEEAIRSISLSSCEIMGVGKTNGSVEEGKDATFFVSSGNALDMRTNQLTEIFIQGRKLNLETHQTKLNDKYKVKYNQK